MAHDEWTKSLSDRTVAKYIYDEIAEVCSATIEIGEYVRSRCNLKGPLTREEVEELFAFEMRLKTRRAENPS
jgi:hypothetical protein